MRAIVGGRERKSGALWPVLAGVPGVFLAQAAFGEPAVQRWSDGVRFEAVQTRCTAPPLQGITPPVPIRIIRTLCSRSPQRALRDHRTPARGGAWHGRQWLGFLHAASSPCPSPSSPGSTPSSNTLVAMCVPCWACASRSCGGGCGLAPSTARTPPLALRHTHTRRHGVRRHPLRLCRALHGQQGGARVWRGGARAAPRPC